MDQSSNSKPNRPSSRPHTHQETKSTPSIVVCRCNNVTQSTLEKVIARGCRDINQIYDATSAGVGACGGSCRIFIARMLESYIKTGTFPIEARPQNKRYRS